MLLYFISFLLIVAFFVLNMFVGVVVENFHKCRQHQEEEEARRREEKRLRRLEKKRRSEWALRRARGGVRGPADPLPGLLCWGEASRAFGAGPCVCAVALSVYLESWGDTAVHLHEAPQVI